jgi:hypothetical protein
MTTTNETTETAMDDKTTHILKRELVFQEKRANDLGEHHRGYVANINKHLKEALGPNISTNPDSTLANVGCLVAKYLTASAGALALDVEVKTNAALRDQNLKLVASHEAFVAGVNLCLKKVRGCLANSARTSSGNTLEDIEWLVAQHNALVKENVFLKTDCRLLKTQKADLERELAVKKAISDATYCAVAENDMVDEVLATIGPLARMNSRVYSVSKVYSGVSKYDDECDLTTTTTITIKSEPRK